MNTSSEITVQLPGGSITALRGDGLVRARGIRYAQAKRFQKPEAILNWSEAQDCTVPSPICPQNPSRLRVATGDLEENRVQDEDCLRLTVVAPESASAAPVVVFIHGGANLSGAGDADAYSPHALAKKGVVGVSITFRLGVFGYVPIPDVAPANLGLLDQIKALSWVQSNIRGFGGDPSNVTIMGQSMGADAIFCLMVSSEASGLFHRAIPQSLPLGRLEDENRDEMTKAMSEHMRKALSHVDPQSIPVSDLLELQKQLLGVARAKSPALLAFAPIFGEYPLPSQVDIYERFIAAAATVPIMIGYTSDEMTAFTHIDPRGDEALPYLTEQFKGSVDRLVARMKTELGYSPPTFEFTWYPKGSDSFKATHCIDLPFLLGDWSSWKNAPMLAGPDSQEVVERVGDCVEELWVSFAKGQDLTNKRFIIDANFKYSI